MSSNPSPRGRGSGSGNRGSDARGGRQVGSNTTRGPRGPSGGRGRRAIPQHQAPRIESGPAGSQRDETISRGQTSPQNQAPSGLSDGMEGGRGSCRAQETPEHYQPAALGTASQTYTGAMHPDLGRERLNTAEQAPHEQELRASGAKPRVKLPRMKAPADLRERCLSRGSTPSRDATSVLHAEYAASVTAALIESSSTPSQTPHGQSGRRRTQRQSTTRYEATQQMLTAEGRSSAQSLPEERERQRMHQLQQRVARAAPQEEMATSLEHWTMPPLTQDRVDNRRRHYFRLVQALCEHPIGMVARDDANVTNHFGSSYLHQNRVRLLKWDD